MRTFQLEDKLKDKLEDLLRTSNANYVEDNLVFYNFPDKGLNSVFKQHRKNVVKLEELKHQTDY